MPRPRLLDFIDGPSRPCHSSRPSLPCDAARQRPAAGFLRRPDFAAYRDWLAEAAREARVSVWAWCLMPSHVHLILVPQDEDGLRRPGGGASSLRRLDPRAAAADRPFLAGPIRRRRDGRGSSRRRLPLREPQSGAGASGRAGRKTGRGRAPAPYRPRRGRPHRLAPGQHAFPALPIFWRGRKTKRRRSGCAKARASGVRSVRPPFLAALETATRRRLRALTRGPKPKSDGTAE